MIVRPTRFRRTLVGLKPVVRRDLVHVGEDGFRRTLVGLKLCGKAEHDSKATGFRRTLVGLKLHVREVEASLDSEFQTNPCGVEAALPQRR